MSGKTRRLEMRTDQQTEQLVAEASAFLRVSKSAFTEDAVRTLADTVLARADVTAHVDRWRRLVSVHEGRAARAYLGPAAQLTD